jgi:Zn-dependent protease with chaperone function
VRDKYDESYHAVISRAAKEARALGHHYVGTEHLLLGFCHEDERDSEPILAPVGITTDVVRAWVKKHDSPVSGASDAGRLVFTPPASSVLRAAQQEADGRRHKSISARHLLLGLIRDAKPPAPEPGSDAARRAIPPGPRLLDALTTLIRDREVDIVSLRRRVIARANSDATGQGFPYLGADLAAYTRLPGTRERWLRHTAVIIGCICLAALVIVSAPPGTQAMATVVAGAASAGLFTLRLVFDSLMYRVYDWVPGVETFEAPGLRSALAPTGIREVTVYCLPHDYVIGQPAAVAFRSGNRGMIRLPSRAKDPTKTDPDLARFTAAHEAAHLARDDSMTEHLACAGRVCIAVIAGLTRPDTLWLLIPLTALLIAIRWHRELACNRMAAEITGRITVRREIDSLSWAEQQIRRRPPLRRLGSWLWWRRTHPAYRMHRNALTRILAKEEQATGSQDVALLPARSGW